MNGLSTCFYFAWDVQNLNLNQQNNTHSAQQDRLWVHSDRWGDFSLLMAPRFRIPSQKGEENSALLGNTAPMPGKIFKVVVKNGQEVKLNDLILIIESMKMEVKITAKREGPVEILVKEGDLVQPGKLLFQFKE